MPWNHINASDSSAWLGFDPSLIVRVYQEHHRVASIGVVPQSFQGRGSRNRHFLGFEEGDMPGQNFGGHGPRFADDDGVAVDDARRAGQVFGNRPVTLGVPRPLTKLTCDVFSHPETWPYETIVSYAHKYEVSTHEM